MANTRVNSREIQRILNSPGARAACMPLARAVLAEAAATAPVDTGDYAASLRMWFEQTDRAVIRVGSDDAFSPLVQAKYGHLRQALRRAAQ